MAEPSLPQGKARDSLPRGIRGFDALSDRNDKGRPPRQERVITVDRAAALSSALRGRQGSARLAGPDCALNRRSATKQSEPPLGPAQHKAGMTDSGLVSEPSWLELSCPFCKGPVTSTPPSGLQCVECGVGFARKNGVLDFRRTYPAGVVVPVGWKHWADEQVEYETWSQSSAAQIDLVADERDVRTLEGIYSKLVRLGGRVLDVGGGCGMARHFLADSSEYLSIDPWLDAPRHLAAQEEKISSLYPRVVTPVPFVAGHAEWLPFRAGVFDWVHMRSCLDHLFDPLQALREAWRVLRPGAHLAVGISAKGGPSAVMEPGARGLFARIVRKARHDGVAAVAERALERIRSPLERDHHIWHPSPADVTLLIESAGFRVEDWRWQDPPNDHCMYVRAIKPERQAS